MLEPRIRDRGELLRRRVEDHEAIRHRKSRLFQAGAIEGLAAGTRCIGGTKTIEGSESIRQVATAETVLYCELESWRVRELVSWAGLKARATVRRLNHCPMQARCAGRRQGWRRQPRRYFRPAPGARRGFVDALR